MYPNQSGRTVRPASARRELWKENAMRQHFALPAVVVLCALAGFGASAADDSGQKTAVAVGQVADAEKDKGIAAQQEASYPLKKCVVSGKTTGGSEAVNYVHKDRLVKLCGKGCITKFEANPAKYLAKLDAAKTASTGKPRAGGDKAATEASHDPFSFHGVGY
jgi:hypothetical protein